MNEAAKFAASDFKLKMKWVRKLPARRGEARQMFGRIFLADHKENAPCLGNCAGIDNSRVHGVVEREGRPVGALSFGDEDEASAPQERELRLLRMVKARSYSACAPVAP